MDAYVWVSVFVSVSGQWKYKGGGLKIKPQRTTPPGMCSGNKKLSHRDRAASFTYRKMAHDEAASCGKLACTASDC